MTEPRELKWLREYSNGRRELKENALKNNSLPDYANFDLEFWKKIYEEGKQTGVTEATKELQEENEELQAKWLSESYEKAKLVEQIEKMKCGQNCKHSYLYQEDRKCKFTYCDCINCKDEWELAE